MERSLDNFYTPPPRTDHRKEKPPAWLMAVLTVCVILIAIFVFTRMAAPEGQGTAASLPPEGTPPQASPSAPASSTPVPSTPSPTPEPSQEASTPSPAPVSLPTAAYGVPIPEGEAKPQSWFTGAVFIGDSRTNGFQMYSGVSEADYIHLTGLSVYTVAADKPVIRSGDSKISVLEALAQKAYEKVYICLGINELGYSDPAGFARTYGKIIDRIREIQPAAILYVQTIPPVNAEECTEHSQFDYVNNNAIREYNTALIQMTAEKQVLLVDAAEALTDSNGELSAEISADGVHFQKEGYRIWRDYLLCHTGT